MKKALKYQLRQIAKPIAVYYLVITALVILNAVTAAVRQGGDGPAIGLNYEGLEMATAIFLFVLCLNSFRENFRMFMQHSRSRMSLFLSGMLAILCVCAAAAVVDTLFGLIAGASGPYTTAYAAFFRDRFAALGEAARTLESIIWLFCAYLVASLTGMFITTLYYRMNKALKLTVSIGVPMLLFIGIPYLRLRYGWRFELFGFTDLVRKGLSGNSGTVPLLSAGTLLLLAAFTAVLCLVLQRRAVIRE